MLRPAGTLLVTTPNRLTFALPNRPMNPFHYRELDPDRAGRAAGGGRVRDQPAARAAARAAAAPVRPPVRLAGGRAAGRAAGDLAPGAAPGGDRGPDDRLRARAPTTSTPASTSSRWPSADRSTSRRRRRSDDRAGAGARRHVLPGAAHPPAVGGARRAPGRSARSGCTRRSPAPGGGCSRCSTGWPPTGARDVLTLGVTPVLAAMLDDPYCLRELHTWAGNWQLRAVEGGAASCRSWPRYEFRRRHRRAWPTWRTAG